MRKTFLFILPFLAFLWSCGASAPHIDNTLRAPSNPLVTIDPYTCAWSAFDRLYDGDVQHWTGKDHPLMGVINVDGTAYRFMGGDDGSCHLTATQTSRDVQATQTHYTFTCGPVELRLVFTSPLLLDDLELMSRPSSYVTYEASSLDGKKHEISLDFSASPLWSLDSPSQNPFMERGAQDGLVYLKSGNIDQNILARKGDDLRIDWGYYYMASSNEEFTADIRDGKMCLDGVAHTGKHLSGKLIIAYDDVYSVQYFGQNLRPYWNRSGKKDFFKDVLLSSWKDAQRVLKRCEKFDNELMNEALEAGGQKYAELCATAYRQAVAAHKLVEGPSGDLFFFSKENFSNGSIGTVDVTYPSSPLFLMYNPELAKGLLDFIFDYSESGRWTKPFPAHDVGTYPLANGQTYPKDMPVEEAGNLLILSAAICKIQNDASYAKKHWQILTTWTEYLRQFGMDPEDQLCTDDFAGHLAHNANLSIKAILGIAGYGMMADMLGLKDVAKEYTELSASMAKEWKKMADAGDHYALVFSQPDSWSMKYNLVWDKMLGFNIFDEDIRITETAWYKKVQNRYGLPLDSRKSYTKIDWIVWTATLAPDREDFEALIAPLWDFENTTPDRVPLGDWVQTETPNWINMKARSVVGGLFIKMLDARMSK